MKLQSGQAKSEAIRRDFLEFKSRWPAKLKKSFNLSWSNWGFGIEPLEVSAARLEKNAIEFIELHGNHYGPDLGYKPSAVRRILSDHGITVAGICGMFSPDNDLSSNRGIHRQAAVDYLKREIEFAAEIGGQYLLVVPGAVGRPAAYDDREFERSVETLGLVADLFFKCKIKAAIEPIRSAEVSLVHTISDARRYIQAVKHPAIAFINGDVYHMQSEESHIAEAIMIAGAQLLNLHMADSNRCALGQGSMDLDTIIMALYLIGHNTKGRYVTPEPLGPGGNPYPAMFGCPDPTMLDAMVRQTVVCFRERQDMVLNYTA